MLNEIPGKSPQAAVPTYFDAEMVETASIDPGSLLNSTGIPMILLDAQLRVRSFTPAVKDLIDLIASDIGRPLGDLQFRFDDPGLLRDAQAVLEKRAPVECEVANKGGRNHLRRSLPCRTGDNRIDGVLITFMDITRCVAAEEANAAKDHFLATVSHELRTPLTGIMLWTKLLEDENGAVSDPARLREGIDAIRSCVEEQQELIEDLLEASRIVAEKLRPGMKPADLLASVRSDRRARAGRRS